MANLCGRRHSLNRRLFRPSSPRPTSNLHPPDEPVERRVQRAPSTIVGVAMRCLLISAGSQMPIYRTDVPIRHTTATHLANTPRSRSRRAIVSNACGHVKATMPTWFSDTATTSTFRNETPISISETVKMNFDPLDCSGCAARHPVDRDNTVPSSPSERHCLATVARIPGSLRYLPEN